jgi:hypothetical protein
MTTARSFQTAALLRNGKVLITPDSSIPLGNVLTNWQYERRRHRPYRVDMASDPGDSGDVLEIYRTGLKDVSSRRKSRSAAA